MKTNLSNLSKIVAILFFTLCLSNFAKSQDLIYKKNKEVLVVKIIEVGIDEIKYKDFSKQDGMTLVIAKAEVYKVKYENGKEQIFLDEMENPNNYANNKRNAIKADFLAPMFGQFTMGYERSLNPGSSIELQLSIIGAGVQNNTDFSASGAFIRVGYKFIKSPDFYLRGMRYSHILKGSYIRPEFTIGQCSETYPSNDNSYSIFGFGSSRIANRDVTFGAIMLNFGKQWVFNDVFLVDYFVGLGYGFSTKHQDDDAYIFNNHAMIGPFSRNPISYTVGLKIGKLLK